MRHRLLDHRTGWLSLGLVAGLVVSYLWPHEPAQAITNSRSEKFELFTARAATAGGNEGVFVLDHLTGQLRGAVLDPQSHRFTAFYYYDLAQDFALEELGGKPQFAIVSGLTQLQNKPGMRAAIAPGVIFVAELTTGKVASYSFPWERTTRARPVIQLSRVDAFSFREADAP